MSTPKHSPKAFKALLCIILCTTIATGAFAQKNSKAQLQKEKTRIEAEIKKLDKELSKAKKNTSLTKSQLAALSKKIDERNRLIRNINSQLSGLDKQIIQTSDTLSVMHARVDSLKNEYGKLIRVLYREHDNLSATSLLLDTTGYNRAFLRLKYFNEYKRYRQHQASNIRRKQMDLQQMQTQLQQQKNEKTALLSEEKKHKEQLTKEQAQKQQSVKTSQQNEKKLQTQIAQKQKQKKELEKQIQKLIAEEVAKANKNRAKKPQSNTSTSKPNATSTPSQPSTAENALSNDFASNKGKLSWPAYYKSITREFGKYRHESGGENMSNGMEFSTAAGASVYAIFKGKTTRVFTCPNGTKGIIIRHGDYMSVYANLSSVSVKEGTDVTTKQTIGTVATSESGQGELSFQLWQGTTPINPRGWLR
ncbi:MAG: peptidoglycan DD-metalloendopeptidase family protein [Bacteroidales bacterium]|nr:peptidoglycan DD-metalloendopeptidase family protein [Bacteroidales bacterium]